MPKRSRRPGDPVTTTVRCSDPITGQSVSFTVYGGRYKDVAQSAVEQCPWRTTSLTDKRHKRR